MSRRRTPIEPITIEAHYCTPAEQRRLLGGAPFFARLSTAEVEEVATAFRQAHYAAGETIHWAGEPATRLCLVARAW